MPRFTVDYVSPSDVRLALDGVPLEGITRYTIDHDSETGVPIVTLYLASQSLDVCVETERVLIAHGAQVIDSDSIASDAAQPTPPDGLRYHPGALALETVSARLMRATRRSDDNMLDSDVRRVAQRYAELPHETRRRLLVSLNLATRDEMTEAELDPAHAGRRLDHDAWRRAARKQMTRALADAIDDAYLDVMRDAPPTEHDANDANAANAGAHE